MQPVQAPKRTPNFALRVGIAALVFVAGLSAASLFRGHPEAAQTVASPSPTTEATQPILVKAGVDVVPAIAAAGPDWKGAALSDNTRYDSDIATYRRVLMYGHGVIKIDRTDGGDLKMVSLSSGLADRCGSVTGALLGVDALLTKIGQPRLSDAERATLTPGAELTRNGILVRTVKGCIWNAVVRPAAGSQ